MVIYITSTLASLQNILKLKTDKIKKHWRKIVKNLRIKK